MQTICFYDLDRTITLSPTWTSFLLRTMIAFCPWRIIMLPTVALAAIGNAVGWISRDRLKELMHGALIGRRVPETRLRAWSERFAEHMIAANIRPGARARIETDRAAGHRLVLATAAHRFYAEPIARRLGIADVIATEAILRDSLVSNRLAGPNLYGPAKLEAVKDWLRQQGLHREDVDVRFYSDHRSDGPCLSFADMGFAVNPGRAMRTLAARRGWPALDWTTTPASAS